MALPSRVFSCACGSVRCEAVGEPILSSVCYCSDCQEGGRRIEALPHAPPVRDADGGTPYLVFRDDRFRCVDGQERLEDHRLNLDSPTRRVVARCCNTGMFLKFDPGFWVSTYRLRYDGELPPIAMRTKIERRHSDLPLPQDAPSYRGFPLRLIGRLMAARLAMAFGL